MVENVNKNSPVEHNPDSAESQSKEAALEAAFLAAKELADKHGYYYSVLPDEEKAAYRLALSQEGFDQEIALLKTKMKSMQFLFNPAMIARFMNLLERLYKAQRNLSKQDEDPKPQKPLDNMFGVFGKMGFPPGMMGPHFTASPGTA